MHLGMSTLQLSVFGGSAWEWEPERKQFYFHSFLTSQPDLNYHNPEILKEMDVSKSFTIKAPIATQVVCFCSLLNCF